MSHLMLVEKVVGQTVARQDPALSESDGEEFLVEVPAGVWADLESKHGVC